MYLGSLAILIHKDLDDVVDADRVDVALLEELLRLRRWHRPCLLFGVPLEPREATIVLQMVAIVDSHALFVSHHLHGGLERTRRVSPDSSWKRSHAGQGAAVSREHHHCRHLVLNDRLDDT
jgi:hypothetical protein